MQKFKGDKTLFSLCRKYKKVFKVLDFDLDEGKGKKDEENDSDDGETDDDDSDDGSDDDDDKDKEDKSEDDEDDDGSGDEEKKDGKDEKDSSAEEESSSEEESESENKESEKKSKVDKEEESEEESGSQEESESEDETEKEHSKEEDEMEAETETEKQISIEKENEKDIQVEKQKETELEKEKEKPVEKLKGTPILSSEIIKEQSIDEECPEKISDKEQPDMMGTEELDAYFADDTNFENFISQAKENLEKINESQNRTKNTARKSTSPQQKMTTRRMKSISPPSFSLGISPVASKPAVETDTAAKKQTPMIEKTAALETETPKNPKRTRKQVAEETKEEEEPAGKRTKKPSRYLVSPYMNNKTVINTPTKPDEMMVTNALFSMQGNPYEFVFETEWAWGTATIKDNMQTLAPKLKVDASVIDSFACTTAIVNRKKEHEEKQYKEFCANLKSVFKGNPEDSSMDHVELAFFPIIAHEHFYLIVFNLEKGTSVILDNSNSGATYESKYSKEIDILKKLFSRYLASYKHKKASDIATKKTTLMKLKWGTKQNVIDCGQDQELEIIRMRIKYATKMLMHELNIHREKINQETFEFASNNTDKALMQSVIREEIDKKQEEQARDHVASAK
ncbi:hypothetical protein CTI12_AA594900 [Artemisia annua]|uniref:Ulp1 protease family, C-terminal catalytic domain-containing protein n=1 Tax=Artemisia annua TaxID=35608 RepID=A0A2U1KJM2_ARTAN|nr:hypothetical protein CTI12_AA594900 [Artemisia annua]